MKNTVLEAIRQVMLTQARPMTAREVYDCIVHAGLYEFKAQNPMHIVGNQIRRHCLGKQASSYSDLKYFEQPERNKYFLLPTPVHHSEVPTSAAATPRRDPNALPSLRERNGKADAEATNPNKRTIIHAIKQVMASNKKAMTVQQVYNDIIAQNLYSFKASQPVHVVRSQIRRHCLGLDFPSAADVKHFECREKHRYRALSKPVEQKSKLSRVGITKAIAESAQKLVALESESKRKQTRTQIFISYSHKDSKWLQRLQVHLRPLEREGAITRWDDTQIRPGTRWRDQIKKSIERARVAVLLISADFLASDFIANNELPPLLEAADSDGAMILPVIVSPCRFDKTRSIQQFQAINDPGKPLIALDKSKREKLFVTIADAIEAALYPA